MVIPDSVTTIGEFAFSRCSGLTSVVIPDSVTTIGRGAFLDDILQVIAIDAVGDKFERVKGLLPDDLQGKVISTHEYNQIKAIRVKACQSYLAERAPRLLPADIWRVVGGLGGIPAEMQRAINTVALPNPTEEGWRESYLKALSEALSNTVPVAPETRETKRQSRAVASRVGLFSSEAFRDDSHLETKMPEPRPAP